MNNYTKQKCYIREGRAYILAVTSNIPGLTTTISFGERTGGQGWPHISYKEKIANAKRLAECWNIFHGINDPIEHINKMKKAILNLIEIIENSYDEDLIPFHVCEIEEARELLIEN